MNINEETNSEEQQYSEEKFNKDLIQEDDNNDTELSSNQDDDYKLGWNQYSELTNGRFAMIGFIAILFIELLSHESFLKWANILN